MAAVDEIAQASGSRARPRARIAVASRSLDDVRAGLIERLHACRAEIVETILARIYDGASASTGSDDAEYVAGQRRAIAAVVDYGLMGLELGEEWAGPIPSEAVLQAHRAARSGVSKDTVLRNYYTGYHLFGDFVVAAADHLPSQVLRQLLRMQGSLFEHLLERVYSEYDCEVERAKRSPEQRRAVRVQRLLAGEPVDLGELHYELEAWHLGVIATGARAREVIRPLEAGLNCELLSMARGEETVWAWFGGQRRLLATDVEHALAAKGDVGVSLAVGEPGWGINGWRMTHRQAHAALRVVLCKPQQLTRFADVLLEAAVLRDEALVGSPVEIYLAPLGRNKGRGAELRETLRNYFAVGCNAATAAHRLNVNRHTIENRLRTIEDKLGRPPRTCQAELEVALRLEELNDGSEA